MNAFATVADMVYDITKPAAPVLVQYLAARPLCIESTAAATPAG